MTQALFRLILCAIAALGLTPLQAEASFLDSDFFCRVKGCVIAHDGVSFDVYDVHIFETNGTVPPGGELIPWTGNPFQGTGQVKPVFTGTITEGFHVIPSASQGVEIGFSGNINGQLNDNLRGNGDGVLDAQDVFGAVQLGADTQLRTLETSIQRSFYISSRTEGFRISATTSLTGTRDALSNVNTLSNVVFDYGVTLNGNDNGLRFGSAATDGGYRRLGNFTTLSPLANTEQFIAEFPQAIRQRFSQNLPEQSIRFDYIYGFEGYDLSLGAGNLQYQIEFRFFRD